MSDDLAQQSVERLRRLGLSDKEIQTAISLSIALGHTANAITTDFRIQRAAFYHWLALSEVIQDETSSAFDKRI